MKKTKLLTSITMVALILTLGGCGEVEEVYTTVSTDPSDSLTLVKEYGAAIDSWSSIQGLWVTSYDYYQDLSYSGLEGYSLDEDNSYTNIYYVEAKQDNDSFTRFLYWLDSYTNYEELYSVYIKDDDGYQNEDGEVNYYEGEAKNDYTFELIISYLVALFEGEYNVFDIFDVWDGVNDVSREGELQTSNLGNSKSITSLAYNFEVTIDDYVIDVDFSHTLDVTYNKNKQLTLFNFSYYCLLVGSEGKIYLERQTINYAPLEGEVTIPSWVIDYEG